MNSQEQSGLGALEPVRGRMGGRGLPVPPLVPIVAVVALLLGVSLGYGLAPRLPDSTTNPSPPSSEDPAPTQPQIPDALETTITLEIHADGSGKVTTIYSYTADGVVILPDMPSTATIPSGGVSLSTALANKGYPVDARNVVAARIVPYSQIGGLGSAGLWVWAIVVRGPGSVLCGGPMRIPTVPASSQPVTTSQPSPIECRIDYETVVVDYATGIWLETDSGFLP